VKHIRRSKYGKRFIAGSKLEIIEKPEEETKNLLDTKKIEPEEIEEKDEETLEENENEEGKESEDNIEGEYEETGEMKAILLEPVIKNKK